MARPSVHPGRIGLEAGAAFFLTSPLLSLLMATQCPLKNRSSAIQLSKDQALRKSSVPIIHQQTHQVGYAWFRIGLCDHIRRIVDGLHVRCGASGR
jgi:hypothetical protein